MNALNTPIVPKNEDSRLVFNDVSRLKKKLLLLFAAVTACIGIVSVISIFLLNELPVDIILILVGFSLFAFSCILLDPRTSVRLSTKVLRTVLPHIDKDFQLAGLAIKAKSPIIQDVGLLALYADRLEYLPCIKTPSEKLHFQLGSDFKCEAIGRDSSGLIRVSSTLPNGDDQSVTIFVLDRTRWFLKINTVNSSFTDLRHSSSSYPRTSSI